MQTDNLTTGIVFGWEQLRQKKEDMLNQHGLVIWMCGLSGSGKSTLAAGLDKELYKRGFLTQIIDGDVVRDGLNKGLGFSDEDRRENLRRVAELAKLFVGCGVITIVSFISPTHESRDTARKVIGAGSFREVYVNAPLEVCEQRDAKGLYKKARQGIIRNFTGIDSPFEPPVKPDIEIETNKLSIEEGTIKLLNYILPIVEYKS